MIQIAWEIFMSEEQAALKKAIEMGLRDFLTQCVIEMTPQKEVELQKLANQMLPTIAEEGSEVLKKYTIDRLKQGLPESPQTPEEEAVLQKMLDEEQLEKQKKYSELHQVKNEALEEAVKPLEEGKIIWKKKS